MKKTGFLQKLRSLAGWSSTWISSIVGLSSGQYASTDPTRKDIYGRLPRNSPSSNMLLGPSLGQLTAQCRYIERNTPLGRAVCEGLKADVVGTGIALRPDSGDAKRDMELWDAFETWAATAMTDGRSLWQWQSIAMGEMGTSGGGLARWIFMPELAAKNQIPWRLLPLEVEWLSLFPVRPVALGNAFVRGIEFDKLCRPVSYHLKHPEDPTSIGEVVPAADIQYVFEKRRSGQLLGEPILAIAVERALQDARLVETELRASVATAAPAIAITSTVTPSTANEDDATEQITDIPGGAVVHLLPGEKAETLANNRPNEKMASFREGMHGDVAAACRTSKAWLDRDPSKANYSSMRMDQLLSKRVTQGLKDTLGHGTAGNAYLKLFPWLMLAIGQKMPRGDSELARATRYTLRPDQPEYVDPMKDVQAAEIAIAANLSTYDIECSARGKDWMEVFRQRQRENAILTQLGLPIPLPKTKADADPEKNDLEETGGNKNDDDDADETRIARAV